MNLKLLNAVKYLSPESIINIASLLMSGEGGYEKDKETALEILVQLAEQGNADSQYLLYCSLDDDGFVESAISWLKKAVEQNHPRALAMAYSEFYSGNIDWLDEEEAIECLKLSADSGFPLAIGMLGSVYLNGNIYVEKNKELAKKYYSIAANKGDSVSLYFMYLLNESEDKELRLNWLKKSAQGGYSVAKYEMWKVLSEEAFNWLEEAIEANELDAHYDFARLQESGVFVDQNFNQSIDEYYRLATMNHIKSAERLCYYAEFKGVTKEYIEFMNILRNSKSLESMAIIAYDQVNNGYSIARNIKYLTIAAKEDCPLAMYFLGNIMMYAEEIEGAIAVKDKAKALNYYYKAAQKGNIDAMEKISFEYIKGNFNDKISSDEVIKFLEIAMENECASAANLLGLVYYNGYLVEKNYDNAITCFEYAIDNGDSNGWYNLMQLYIESEKYDAAEVCFKNALDSENYFAMKDYIENYEDFKEILRNYDINYFMNKLEDYRSVSKFYIDLICDEDRIISSSKV